MKEAEAEIILIKVHLFAQILIGYYHVKGSMARLISLSPISQVCAHPLRKFLANFSCTEWFGNRLHFSVWVSMRSLSGLK